MTTVRKKTGGRTKGTPNKKTEELLELIEDTGCMHPITGLARIAQQTYNNGDFATSMGAFKELAHYVAPKRKAIEHSGEIDTKEPFVIVVDSSVT